MLPKIDNILVATDLSENADNALRHALSIAIAHGAKTHVLHVTEPLSQDAIVTLNMFIQDDKSRQQAIKDRHAAVKRLLKDNQQAFLKSLSVEDQEKYSAVSSIELVDGHPAEEILKRAKKLSCDLIVMGSHEQGTSHTFLGTVVKRVLRRSTIPTLVVPNLE
ncbi:universal stress protein [Ruegeria sp.]|uniref:universal stress protein n=1 Tax=Ruegeria sp. TaxID=1879320 RepID=UPI003B5921E5